MVVVLKEPMIHLEHQFFSHGKQKTLDHPKLSAGL